jgi:hypothetical protein
VVLGVGPGIAGGGPSGADGADAGQLLLGLNSVALNINVTDDETFGPEALALYNALAGAGFDLAPPDAFGDVAIDFSDPTNFALIGSPADLLVTFAFSDTADNLDITIDAYVPEPGSLALIGTAFVGLSILRKRIRARRTGRQ